MTDDQDQGLRDLARAAAPGLADALTAGFLTDVGTANTPAAIAGGFIGLAIALDNATGQRRLDRLAHMLEDTADRIGGAEALTTQALATDEHAELLRRVLEAGARTTLDVKLRTLARVLANGLDGTSTIDEATIFAAALHDMEAPHVQILEAIERWGRSHGQRAQLPDGRAIVQRNPMPFEQIRSAVESIDGIVDSVIATLERHGLIRDHSVGAQSNAREFRPTVLGERLLDLLTDAA